MLLITNLKELIIFLLDLEEGTDEEGEKGCSKEMGRMQGQRGSLEGMSRACSALRHVLSSEHRNKPSLNGKEREHTDAGERGLI